MPENPSLKLIPFDGFPDNETASVRLPDTFFTELLAKIDDLNELKLTIYCFWAIRQRETAIYRYLRRADLLADKQLLSTLSDSAEEALSLLDAALSRATARGTLLAAEVDGALSSDVCYFLNTQHGRAAVEALHTGEWLPVELGGDTATMARPNIYELYERHFGPLTPLTAEKLRDTEQTYPFDWIEAAVQTAVERQTRYWQYVENVLKRWLDEGPPHGLVRSPAPRDRAAASRAYGQFWQSSD